MTGLREACPACDSLKLYHRREKHDGKGKRHGDLQARFVCKQCGERFDEPHRRPREANRNGGAGNNGLARFLAHPDVSTLAEARELAAKERGERA